MNISSIEKHIKGVNEDKIIIHDTILEKLSDRSIKKETVIRHLKEGIMRG